jgi:apolipoprotein N-acyltransferase
VLLAGGSGALLSLSLPPLAWWPLAYVAPIPLLWLVRGQRPRRGAALGAVFGAAYFGLLLYWLFRFGALAWGALVVLSAVSLAIFGLLAPIVWRREHPVASSAVLAAAWTAIEFVRSSFPLGGFSWGQLGSTQVDAPTLKLASVTGVWGLSFAVLLVAALILHAVERWGRGPARRAVLATAAAVAVIVAGPLAIALPAATGPAIDVATIQVDVNAAGSLEGVDRDRAVAAMNEALHRSLAGQRPEPDLVVWGEGALDPGASADAPTMEAVRRTIADVGAPTLVGAVIDDPDGSEHTSTLAFAGDGSVIGRYDKVHLVPFGEYVPWRSWLEGRVSAIDQIPVDRVPGTSVRPLRLPGLPPVGTPICYENSFPSIERDMVRAGARFLVLTINNASYGRSAASEQHLLMTRLRAVEDGRWIVHAAVSGISAIVDPAGDVVDRRELFEPAVMRDQIRASSATTLYVRFGDWLPWGSLVLVGAGVFVPRRPRRRRRSRDPLPESPRVLVVLPTYDEAETIGEVLASLLAMPGDIDLLVVDDSSPDGTADIVRPYAQEGSRVTLVERPHKSGLASAYLLGFQRGIEDGYHVVVEMDSDLSHRPDELPRLIEGVRAHDMVIGSRYVPGGSVTNWSRGRVLLSRAGNLYARLALGFDLRDATSGFRVYRMDVVRTITTTPIETDGYGFQIELAYRAWRDGFDVGEIPITFSERAHGRSKISNRIIVEAFLKVAVWGVAARFRGP